MIVDFQNDFTPGGALAVPHGDEVAERLNALAASGDYDLVVATRDWHPADHGSLPPAAASGRSTASRGPPAPSSMRPSTPRAST